MENVYKKDGTELKIMTEEDEKLIDIKDKLNLNDWYDVHNAYCSNGIVYITLMIRMIECSQIHMHFHTDNIDYHL